MRKFSSFMLAILMVVATMFTGAVEAKADTGATYDVGYNVEEGEVVGAPAVGTVLSPEDVIKAGDNLPDGAKIRVNVHAFEEEITDDARGYIAEIIEKGEQVDISTLRTSLETGETGFTVAKIDDSDWEDYSTIVISVYANDSLEKLENVVIEFDWSKFEVELGGTISSDNFKEGFVKADKLTSKVVPLLGEIVVISPDGTEDSVFGDVEINETDSYKIYAVLILEDGYYLEVDDEVVVNDSTVKEGEAGPHTEQSHYWSTRILATIDLGTYSEMVERVENAKAAIVPPQTGDEDKEEEKPPVVEENKDNVSDDTVKESSPKTGDTVNVPMCAMMFVCVVGLLVISRKWNKI